MAKKLLVTGGAGYIGSHTCVELMMAGYETVILDNFANSKRNVIHRLERIVGGSMTLIEGDVRNPDVLNQIFLQHDIFAVLHFAGLKAVSESISRPLEYYDVNVHGSITLARTMAAHKIKTFVFSSSATVYGYPETVPIRECFALDPTTPYGRSKLMVEKILNDLFLADSDWRIGLLRYFNPVGAHESGWIGEEPAGIPNNLMPYVSQVAIGQLEFLSIFGSDYPTPDGTGIRDYIHVVDLAQGHVAALRYLEAHRGVLTVNLGTGRGSSVLDVVKAFEKASRRKIKHRFVAPRPGDVASCYADPSKAATLLNWKALRDMDSMCTDTWRWQQWAGKTNKG
jgi:UDP-glucose 4-epimerase